MSTISRLDKTSEAIISISSTTLKINASDIYYRDQNKLQAFLAQCNMYIQFNALANKLGTYKLRVIFAAIYLREEAFN
jgi:hypothetical protein